MRLNSFRTTSDLRATSPLSRAGLVLLYLLWAALITIIWTGGARTEKKPPPLASIVRAATGVAEQPFVYRRLVPDASQLVARVVPVGAWEKVSSAIDDNPRISAILRERLGWERPNDPILISATALIGLSVLGFLVSANYFVAQLYHCSPAMRHTIALLLGIGLLGGRGDNIWHQYPYDLPNAFLFLATTVCILGGSWLMAPLFALAVYNKETSVLLVPIVLLLWPGSRRQRFAIAACMFVAFVAIQVYIRAKYAGAPDYPHDVPLIRNFKAIGLQLIFGNWELPAYILLTIALIRNLSRFPNELRVLLIVPLVLVAAAIVMGWIEERRGYFEAYPIVALMLFQTILIELNQSHRLVPRHRPRRRAAPVAADPSAIVPAAPPRL